MTRPKVGDTVFLSTPDNPRADGQNAIVAAVADWGCHLTNRVRSGAFRALWGEMLHGDRPRPVREPPPVSSGADKGGAGYSGDTCPQCQGTRMVRSGTCSTCQDCGGTSGCS